VTGIARFRSRPCSQLRLGQNARRAGLTHATGAGKEKGMGNPPGFNGILQSAADMFLTGQVRKSLGTVFTGKDDVGHEKHLTGGAG